MGREVVLASTRPVSASICWCTYLAALAVAAAAFVARPEGADAWQTGLVAIVASTVTIFCFSLACSNTSLYDPAWCILPIATAIGWISMSGGTPSARAVYALALPWCSRYGSLEELLHR